MMIPHQPPSPWRKPQTREQAKQQWERLRDYVQEMKDSGWLDEAIDLAVQQGIEQYHRARRESATERDGDEV